MQVNWNIVITYLLKAIFSRFQHNLSVKKQMPFTAVPSEMTCGGASRAILLLSSVAIKAKEDAPRSIRQSSRKATPGQAGRDKPF